MRNTLYKLKGFLAFLENKLEKLSPLEGFVLACIFIGVWTTYDTVTEMPVALKHDMTETYSWGQEFQLGYHQHPPFWAWLCGVWFAIFPSTLLSFAALSATNAALGLWGVWLLTAKLVKDPTQRLIARLLPLLTPVYTFYAFKFNANIIFLSLWPWTLYFFFEASEQKKKNATLLFGVFVGLNLLSKYYALLPLAGCVFAALCTTHGRQWLRSLQPWRAAIVAAVLATPHGVWLVQNQAPPIAYLRAKLGLPWHDILTAAIKAESGLLGMMGGVIALLAVFAIWHKGSAVPPRPLSPPLTVWVAILSVTPIVLTLICGLALKTVIMAEMMLGLVPLLPLLLFQAFGRASSHTLARAALLLVVGLHGIALLAAPFYAVWRVEFTKSWQKQLPIQDMALESTRLWVEKTHAPLVYVAGSTWYANATSFYSPYHPHSFPNHDRTYALWVTPERLRKYGVLSICPHTAADAGCLEGAARFATAQTVQIPVTMAHHFAGHTGRPQTFTVVITPPSP